MILKSKEKEMSGRTDKYHNIPSSPSLDEAISNGQLVLEMDIAAIQLAKDLISPTFEIAVIAISKCPGNIVLSGVGKSGFVAKKICGTMASLGLRAMYVHAGDAAHGDIGAVHQGDVTIVFSYSGETSESLWFLGSVKERGCISIAITGNSESTLAKGSDIVLEVGKPEKNNFMRMIPTGSVVASLAVGDALAIASATFRGAKEDDFIRNHPCGYGKGIDSYLEPKN